jgi:hypothetical protein
MYRELEFPIRARLTRFGISKSRNIRYLATHLKHINCLVAALALMVLMGNELGAASQDSEK